MLPRWGSPMFFASKNQPDKENQPNTHTQNRPQTLTSGSFIELFWNYKDNTQSFVSSNVAQQLETVFSFYLSLLNTLQTLPKPFSPFMESTITLLCY